MFSEKMLVPQHIENLQPYVAGKTIAEVREAYNPERISKLASNENRMGCSPVVSQAVQNALNHIQDYPDPLSRNLRQIIADRNGVSPENVMLAAGSESIISILCRTFFSRHENAVTADTTFVGFYVQASVQDIELKKVPLTGDFRFDVHGLLKAINSDTRMVYIANPNNPTGTFIGKDEYTYLLENIPDSVLLVNDEAYFEYSRDVSDYPSALEYTAKNVIILRTFSKAYGLAGCRVGYAIADESIIRNMMKTKLTFEPTTLAQAAASAAFEDADFIEKSINMVTQGRKRLYRFFGKHDIQYLQSVSNSVLMILGNEKDSRWITQKMMENGVILRRTNAFGLPNAIRVTIGLQDEMDHFEKSLEKILKV